MKKYKGSTYDTHTGQLNTGYKDISEMKRCYENYDRKNHKFKEHCSCGNATRVSETEYYCFNRGNMMKICGYSGMCGYIIEPEELKEKQLSFF